MKIKVACVCFLFLFLSTSPILGEMEITSPKPEKQISNDSHSWFDKALPALLTCLVSSAFLWIMNKKVAVIKADLDKRLHSFSTLFDHEYTCYKELWDKICVFELKARLSYEKASVPRTDAPHQIELMEAYNDLIQTVKRLSPFIDAYVVLKILRWPTEDQHLEALIHSQSLLIEETSEEGKKEYIRKSKERLSTYSIAIGEMIRSKVILRSETKLEPLMSEEKLERLFSSCLNQGSLPKT